FGLGTRGPNWAVFLPPKSQPKGSSSQLAPQRDFQRTAARFFNHLHLLASAARVAKRLNERKKKKSALLLSRAKQSSQYASRPHKAVLLLGIEFNVDKKKGEKKVVLFIHNASWAG
ncbi:uncharacterized protein PgNI_04163, partial [Pyricularia grisea]|uniref:Uncharacterized protein n=1 Tax=Pyricularia grisea TaxID=148305 RepID=A0A6P8BAU8_PYRGI